MINTIERDELPIEFTMELAMNPEAMNHFSGLTEPEQRQVVNRARNTKSHEDVRNYVENMLTEGWWRMDGIQIPGRQEPGRQEPLELPGRNSNTYGDGDIPKVDLPGADSATHGFPQEFPENRTRS